MRLNDGLPAKPPFCFLGHRDRAYECPACGEAVTGQKATLEHWRWYRGRTGSAAIKAAIDSHLASAVPFTPFTPIPSRDVYRGTAALFAVRGRYWWRGRLWCPGCYGKHWLWRTVSRCG